MVTLIAIIFGIITLLGLFFYPFFDGSSIYDIVQGPKIHFQSIYPPKSDEIDVRYENIGEIQLKNIEIRYRIYADSDYFAYKTLPDFKAAEIDDRLLTPGESGRFTIRPLAGPYRDCVLVKDYPEVKIYLENETGQCYFKMEGFPKNLCVPYKIEISFYSEQIPDGRNFTLYYPMAPAGFLTTFYLENIDGPPRQCSAYDDNLSLNLTYYKKGNLSPFENLFYIMTTNDKLAKKYCIDDLMPPEWCIKNNLDAE